MLNIVICDDDYLFRKEFIEHVKNILKEKTDKFKIIEFNCGEDLVENYSDNIDIFFLDIEMKDITGIDVAKKIRETNDKAEIIFTTGLIDYMQIGYEVRAYRYLLKPIQFEKLKEHINKCVDDIMRKRSKNLIIKNKGSIYNIAIEDIMFVEVINKDIMIHTKKQVYKLKTSMRQIEKELERYDFYRCHKGFLVNIKKIDSISKNMIVINDTEVPVSRYRIKDLRIRLVSILGDIIC